MSGSGASGASGAAGITGDRLVAAGVQQKSMTKDTLVDSKVADDPDSPLSETKAKLDLDATASAKPMPNEQSGGASSSTSAPKGDDVGEKKDDAGEKKESDTSPEAAVGGIFGKTLAAQAKSFEAAPI